jgi:hypothetical protein
VMLAGGWTAWHETFPIYQGPLSEFSKEWK